MKALCDFVFPFGVEVTKQSLKDLPNKVDDKINEYKIILIYNFFLGLYFQLIHLH